MDVTNDDHRKDTRKVEPVTPKERERISEALMAKYGVYLRPGEQLGISVTREADHSYAQIVLEAPDETHRLELEAAALTEDQADDSIEPERLFRAALDLVDLQLDTYFQEERTQRFHLDWKLYEYGGVNVRFRGQERRPNLEALADAWLASGGEPEEPSSDD